MTGVNQQVQARPKQRGLAAEAHLEGFRGMVMGEEDGAPPHVRPQTMMVIMIHYSTRKTNITLVEYCVQQVLHMEEVQWCILSSQ